MVPDKLYRISCEVMGRGALESREWHGIQRAVDRIRHSGRTFDFSTEPRPLTMPLEILRCMQAQEDVIDQEEQIYRCLEFGIRTNEKYDLILVDEAQDLNRNNILFIKHCLLSLGTVLCVVGDPCQAIYAFRGALNNSFGELQRHFDDRRLIFLKGCFRCPRRITALAAHLNPLMHGSDLNENIGSITLHRGVPSTAWIWKTMHSIGPLVILSRTNGTILQLLRQLHRCKTYDWVRMDIQWTSATVCAHLQAILDRSPSPSLRSVRKERDLDPMLDMTVSRIIQMASEMDDPTVPVGESCFVGFVSGCLNCTEIASPMLTFSTVHAFKGRESRNVLILDYNRFGRSRGDDEDVQDQNLLYIAITRSTNALMLVAWHPLKKKMACVPIPVGRSNPQSIPSRACHSRRDVPRLCSVIQYLQMSG